MAEKKLVTKKPTGVTLTRKGKRFIVKWKIADKDYGDGQDAKYKIGSGKWKSFDKVTTKTTKKAFSVNTNKYYPNDGKPKLTRVRIRLQGNRKKYEVNNVKKDPEASGWRNKTFEILPPDNPKVATSTGTWPTCAFGWKVDNDVTAHKWFTRVEYQHVLLVNSNKKPSELTESEWAGTASNARDAHSGTSGSADSYISVTEDSSTFEIGKSYTRYFRIRSQGPAGVQKDDKGKATVWSYDKHVYADSQQAKIIDTIVEKNDAVSGYTCQVKFTATITRMFPIDKIVTQYALAVPTEGLEPPDGISWSDGLVSIPKNSVDDENSAIFTIDQLPSVDQCLFVRVNTVYDDRTTYGEPLMVDYGRLAAPTGLTVQTDSSTHRATVMATNNSQITDSFLEVLYITKDHPNGMLVGVIPNGESRAVVQCPSWSDEDEVSFGVRAVVATNGAEYVGGYIDRFRLTEDTTMQIGKTYYQRFVFGGSESFLATTTYNASTNPNAKGWYELPDDTVQLLEINYQMVSPIVTSGGDVPVAPKNVMAVMYDNNGTIRVTWDWAWEIADRAEVSWSDHEDAWESTDEPATFIVSKMKASALNISGLETGIKWWVRVRLIAGLEDDATYGAYADANGGVPVNLASAPAIPAVEVSEPVITVDGTTTVSWGYVTTDGTEQLAATIAEILANGQIREIATVGSEYYYDLNAAEQGWSYGETHQIVVSVVSQSGRASDDWSIPVPVTIAEPLMCEIAETSLVMQSNEINPEVYTDDLVTFETDTEQPVTKLSVDLEPVQDLNGYDHPWVGGAGKNKLLPKPANYSNTNHGITCAWDAEAEVFTISGTDTSDSAYIIWQSNYGSGGNSIVPELSAGDRIYMWDNLPTGVYASLVYTNTSGGASTMDFQRNPSGGGKWQIVPENYSSFLRLQIGVYGSATTLSGQFRFYVGFEEVASWEPYENICPITGRDGVSVTRAGANIYDDDLFAYKGISRRTYGTNVASLLTLINRLPAGTYTFLMEATVDTVDTSVSTGFSFGISLAKSAGGYVDALTTQSAVAGDLVAIRKTFAITSEAVGTFTRAYLYASRSGASNDLVTITRIGVELGSTATDYEPYQGETITQEFVDAQGNTLTVYGGEDEIVGGVLTVERAMITYDGSADEAWGTEVIQALNNARSFYILRPSDDKAYADTDISNMLCNACPLSFRIWEYGMMRPTAYYNFVLGDALGISTVADWRTWLSNNPVQVVYELATPITYTLTPQQVESLIGTNNIWSDAGEVTVRTPEAVEDGYALKSMPLTATVTGVGNAGVTTLIVERAEEYETERPDESDQVSFKGETVILAQTSESTGAFRIENGSSTLLGRFDDGAEYLLRAIVKDNLGQVATLPEPIKFMVDWTDQAIIPEAESTIDDDWMVSVLSPIAPDGARDTDTCDIYRLSVDKPELIYSGAQFGEQYVDPYPAIGQFGGHRFVLVTENGDYITEDQEFAWTDTGEYEGDLLDTDYNIIEFGRGRVMLDRNIDMSWTWSKNFKVTHYLGGPVEGDWIDDGVGRDGNVNAVAITLTDQETIESMRRLATYVGICHVRTIDGSSFAANVDVQEGYSHDTGNLIANFSMKITRVDPQQLEGMTLHDWRKMHNGEL